MLADGTSAARSVACAAGKSTASATELALSDAATRSGSVVTDGVTRSRGDAANGHRTQRSTSPTTKKIDPRIEIRSGSCVPGSIAGITLTFENDGVRILRR